MARVELGGGEAVQRGEVEPLQERALRAVVVVGGVYLHARRAETREKRLRQKLSYAIVGGVAERGENRVGRGVAERREGCAV